MLCCDVSRFCTSRNIWGQQCIYICVCVCGVVWVWHVSDVGDACVWVRGGTPHAHTHKHACVKPMTHNAHTQAKHSESRGEKMCPEDRLGSVTQTTRGISYSLSGTLT